MARKDLVHHAGIVQIARVAENNEIVGCKRECCGPEETDVISQPANRLSDKRLIAQNQNAVIGGIGNRAAAVSPSLGNECGVPRLCAIWAHSVVVCRNKHEVLKESPLPIVQAVPRSEKEPIADHRGLQEAPPCPGIVNISLPAVTYGYCVTAFTGIRRVLVY